MIAVDWQAGPILRFMKGELLEAERVHSIVGGFYTVYNYYGYGLSEPFTPAISYLRATPFQVGVLLHFGPRPMFYRSIDFPKRSPNRIRAHSSNSCPVQLESTSGEGT